MNFSLAPFHHFQPGSPVPHTEHDYRLPAPGDDENQSGQERPCPATNRGGIEPNPMASPVAVEQPQNGIFQPRFSLGTARLHSGRLEMVLIQNPGDDLEASYAAELSRQPLLDHAQADQDDAPEDDAPRVEQLRSWCGTAGRSALKAGSIALGGASLVYGLSSLADRQDEHTADNLAKALMHVVLGARLVLCGLDVWVPNIWGRNRP